MFRASLARQSQQHPLEPRVPGEVDRRMAVEFAALPVEPRDDALRIPYVSQELHQPSREHKLARRCTAFLAEPLKVARRDARQPRLIGLTHSRKSLLQRGHKRPGIVLADANMLIQ